MAFMDDGSFKGRMPEEERLTIEILQALFRRMSVGRAMRRKLAKALARLFHLTRRSM
jgi:hypothetical protein